MYETPARPSDSLRQSKVEFSHDITTSARHQSRNGASCNSERSGTYDDSYNMDNHFNNTDNE